MKKEDMWILLFFIKRTSIFDKCSMLQQTQSQPKHTSYTNFHFNEFATNALHDNKGSKKLASSLRKKMWLLLIFMIFAPYPPPSAVFYYYPSANLANFLPLHTWEMLTSLMVKGHLISKANCEAEDSSKKWSNEFVFTI